MKKIGLFILISFFLVNIVSCGINNGTNDTQVLSSSEGNEIIPVQSFGNQYNQKIALDKVIKYGDWIYAIENTTSGVGSIVRFQLDNPNCKDTIYRNNVFLNHLSVFDDWIYFTLRDTNRTEGEQIDLYRMKKDGGEITKLADKTKFYILTKNEIYYSSYIDGLSSVRVIKLNGEDDRKVIGKGHLLTGIDNGWIYYTKDDGEEVLGPYRIKLDGTMGESELDPGIDTYDDAYNPYIVDKNQLYFYQFDNGLIHFFVKKNGGKKMELTTVKGSSDATVCINKENEWLYLSVENAIYKINVNDEGEKELIYKADDTISSILIYDKELLLSTFSNCAYIKKDDVVIDMGRFNNENITE